MRNEGVLKNVGMDYVNMHGFHGNPFGFENGGMPTQLFISQLLLILDY